MVTTGDGESVSSQFLITAVGCLSASRIPEFSGLEDFQGEVYHTGQWPHEGVDLRGKRVGVIGTGSSGIQSIPQFAASAEHVTVFQRTPNFSIAAHNRALSAEEQANIKVQYPSLRAQARTMKELILDNPNEQSALEVSLDECRRVRSSLVPERIYFHGLLSRPANGHRSQRDRSGVRPRKDSQLRG